MNLAIAQQTYIVESRELLRDMENALLRWKNAAGRGDHRRFPRSPHHQGVVGAFSFDAIVEFAHAMEAC
jgi:two-component system chemotaxis sensor kinase CheA